MASSGAEQLRKPSGEGATGNLSHVHVRETITVVRRNGDGYKPGLDQAWS